MTTWIGPDAEDLVHEDSNVLRHPVPPERWPYGTPDMHETCCKLHRKGLFCDCKASDASDDEYGDGPVDLYAAQKEQRARDR